MVLQSLDGPAFRPYGRVIGEIDFLPLIDALASTPCPADAVVYEPSDPALEALPVAEALGKRIFGELPIQVGYCNGANHLLNAVEYHHTGEVNVAATDMILLLGRVQDITDDQTYDCALIEAFLVPRGTAVELYATTLHYAPCIAGGGGFRVAIVLPRGTNTELESTHTHTGEDRLITAKNKWLIGHRDGGLPQGVHLGLLGENLSVSGLI